ncbi:MAG: tetratricopeptide repeat protein, partial [Gemmatimonadetes bacterium]|nr:tetratricopeptide repeat protein [Gemmatimonadota bacterium]
AAAGNRAEAIRQYESYERALKAEDLEPLDHTRALIESVRQSSASPSPTGPPSATSREESQPLRAATAATVPPSSPRRQLTAIALATALVLAGVGWWTANRYRRADSTPARSIAVLPFLNLSADPAASEHLSDGLAEELIHALSQTDSLRVAARTSSFRFRNKDLGIQTIGDSLRVALVLEGSVRQEGSRLRVTAQLINVSDGYHLWSRTFDRELTEVLSLQQEIAAAIVDALRLTLATPERTRLAVGATTDSHAYDLFLRGRYLLQRGTRTAVRGAIQQFDSAVVTDPNYALAHAELAQAYVLAAARGDLPREESLRTAKSAAERAIRLAPTLSEAHAALGRVELELWNWSAAEREAKLAIELHPANSSAHATYTGVLMVLGRTDEAVREAEAAAELEPLSAAAVANYAEALRAARKFEQAVEVHRRALELEPDLGRQNLAKTYVELGRYDEALEEFRAALAAGAPRFPMVELLWTAYTYARAGRREEAASLLRQFEGRQPRGPNAYLLASAYMALGDTERVFQLLEGAVTQEAQPAWRQLPWDPTWDPIRKDPRFLRILARMNL